jgi:phosphoglycolate phosphatase
MVMLALGEMGVTREEAVYIGDSEVDLATARNAGLDCITVLWGFRDRDWLETQGARTFAERPEDIVKLLED